MSNNSKQKKSQELSAAANGVKTQIPATVTLNLAGQSLTPAQLVTVLSAAVTAIDAVAPAKAQLQQLVAAQASAIGSANVLFVALKKYVEAQFGKGSPVLAAFGFSTALPQKPSAQTKALAAAKAKQTRATLGTKGKKQKLAVLAAASPSLVLVGPTVQQIPAETPGSVGPVPPGSIGSKQ